MRRSFKIGETIAGFTVLRYKGGVSYDAACHACGHIMPIASYNLSRAKRMCGTLRCATCDDLTGKRFNKLMVVSLSPSHNGKRQWLCQCDCGRNAIISGVRLRLGQMSCGANGCKPGTSHGLSKKSCAYVRWKTMKARCLNPRHQRFADYGGRGVSICRRWMKFENFLSDMGEPPTGMFLDRKDNAKGYGPDNCRWVTPKQSTANRSNTIRVSGMRVNDLARKLSIPPSRIYGRLRYGWTASRIKQHPEAMYNGK